MPGEITLFELVTKTGEPGLNFSPSVWKTKIDMAILKVQPETIIGQSFHEIRTDLTEFTGNLNVTVPTIFVDGEYITDSWNIAQYLEKHYASTEHSLFGHSEAGKGFAKLIEIWSMTTLAMELVPLLSPAIDPSLDPESAAYVFRTKHKSDQTLVDQMSANAADPIFVANQCAKARSKLQLIENFLAFDGRTFLMGNEPSHADACLFGWYAFGRVNRDLIKGVWEHESLPCVRRWVGNMMKRGLARKEDLF